MVKEEELSIDEVARECIANNAQFQIVLFRDGYCGKSKEVNTCPYLNTRVAFYCQKFEGNGCDYDWRAYDERR